MALAESAAVLPGGEVFGRLAATPVCGSTLGGRRGGSGGGGGCGGRGGGGLGTGLAAGGRAGVGAGVGWLWLTLALALGAPITDCWASAARRRTRRPVPCDI
eukprot:scaffold33908_cov25-Tisochrysis_lutea.AAC.1